MAISKISALALIVSFALASSVTQAAVNSNWRGTILCTAQTALGGRSLGVDDQGHVAELMLRRAVPPGWRVDVREGAPSMSRGALSAHSAGTIRVLGRAKEPFIVRTRLIEDGYAHYGFYRRGRPWLGCRVRFDGAAAVSVAKLILSGQAATLTLGLHDGKLVHLGPQERARSGRGEAAKAKADLQRFLALIAHGRSVAACATLARDALLIHGGPDGCIMDFESAKFIYRDRYAHASVERIALFTLGGDSYALATINRGSSRVCAFLVRERGAYRYLGDFELSRIELW